MSLAKEKKKAYNRAYYYANRERLLEHGRKYRATHKERTRQITRSKEKREYWKEYRKKHRELYAISHEKWLKKNPKKKRAQRLLQKHPKEYPLDSKCEFCGRTGKLEHGHIDYEYPELYLTVCHECNWYMGASVEEI